jgi:putative peptidoglycan lipid II flippase
MSVVKSFLSLSSLTLLSRISGFVKVAAFAAFYGRAAEADMFLAVMIIPDLLYKFLSEGLVSGAAVPLFVELKDEPDRLQRALTTICWLALVVGIALTAILSINAATFCRWLTPGFSFISLQRMQVLWIIVSFYLVTGLLGGVLTSFLNARKLFAAPAIGPLLVNLAIIVGIFIVAGGTVEKIGAAVIFGSVLQLFWLSFLVVRQLDRKLSLWEFDKNIAVAFIASAFPIAAWISVLPFIPIYERYLLSMQPVGSVAALNYVEKLFNLPLGLISISLARVILPELSGLKGKNRRNFLIKVLCVASLVIVPVVIFSVLMAEPLVKIVFKRGQFSGQDAVAAAGLFASYAYALLPITLCMILNRGFFAARKYFFPFFAGLSAAGAQFYLGRPMVEQYGINGIGYAAALAFTVQLAVLLAAELKSMHKLAGS